MTAEDVIALLLRHADNDRRDGYERDAAHHRTAAEVVRALAADCDRLLALSVGGTQFHAAIVEMARDSALSIRALTTERDEARADAERWRRVVATRDLIHAWSTGGAQMLRCPVCAMMGRDASSIQHTTDCAWLAAREATRG